MLRTLKLLLATGLAFAATGVLRDVQAKPVYRVLHAFGGGGDGAHPMGGLMMDSAGNLYGTTFGGGDADCNCGVVFRLSPSGSETVLYAFKGGSDGVMPKGPLITDVAGNLYGTTYFGGNGCGLDGGCGTVFRVAPDATETVLYAFKGGSDGAVPAGGLLMGRKGNLYGTTLYGGGGDCNYYVGGGCGMAFKLTPGGRETMLHAFAGGTDGAVPRAGLISDKAGNLFGTTYWGGHTCSGDFGCGTVFKLARGGSETVLHAFTGRSDSEQPDDTLLADQAGNFFGTTGGTAFKITPDGTETPFHTFVGTQIAVGGLVVDGKGNFYGMTFYGGGKCAGQRGGCGLVFRLAPDGTEKVIHRFRGTEGAYPDGKLVIDAKGNLYGETQWSGPKAKDPGVVFEITP